MALSFTDDEKVTLMYAFGWDISDLNYHITLIDSPSYTAAINTRLTTDIATLKTDMTKDHINIEPNVANFGARIGLSSKAKNLTLRIAGVLDIPASSLNLAGSNKVSISRG